MTYWGLRLSYPTIDEPLSMHLGSLNEMGMLSTFGAISATRMNHSSKKGGNGFLVSH